MLLSGLLYILCSNALFIFVLTVLPVITHSNDPITSLLCRALSHVPVHASRLVQDRAKMFKVIHLSINLSIQTYYTLLLVFNSYSVQICKLLFYSLIDLLFLFGNTFCIFFLGSHHACMEKRIFVLNNISGFELSGDISQ